MRVKETVKKNGFFWLPGEEDKKVPGALTILDGGTVQLEVVGQFSDSFAEGNGLARIVGYVERGGYVTLDQCIYMNRHLSLGPEIISKFQLYVHKAFIGATYEATEQILFNSLEFYIDGLDEWVGRSGVKINNKLPQSYSITYTPQNNIVFNLANGFELQICFAYNFPIDADLTINTLRQEVFLCLVSTEEKPLSEFLDVVHKLTRFFCLALDYSVCVSKIRGINNTPQYLLNDSTKKSLNVQIFYQSASFTSEVPKVTWHETLFQYNNIESIAERLFNAWLKAYDRIAPAMDLYFSVRAEEHKYVDGKFLALAQGLETYHRRTSEVKQQDEQTFRDLVARQLRLCPKAERRWMHGRLKYGNEISLAKRINLIIEPFKSFFGNKKEQKKLIRQIVNTRNYLTHYSPTLKDLALTGSDLYRLARRLEGLFQLNLLSEIGFTRGEIENILLNNDKLRKKLNKPVVSGSSVTVSPGPID